MKKTILFTLLLMLSAPSIFAQDQVQKGKLGFSASIVLEVAANLKSACSASGKEESNEECLKTLERLIVHMENNEAYYTISSLIQYSCQGYALDYDPFRDDPMTQAQINGYKVRQIDCIERGLDQADNKIAYFEKFAFSQCSKSYTAFHKPGLGILDKIYASKSYLSCLNSALNNASF